MKSSGMTCRRSLLLLAALTVCANAAAQERRVLRERAVLKRHTKGVAALAFSFDGKTMASAGKDDTVRLWDLATGKHTATYFTGNVNCLAFSRDGKTLALGRNGVVLLEAATGKELATLEAFSHGVHSLAYSPDGNWLAAGGNTLTEAPSIKMWDARTNKEAVKFKTTSQSSHVHLVVFSPDGKTLATAASDGGVRLWEVATGKELAVLGGNSAMACSVAFSPDGKTLAATCGKYHAVVLWDLATLKERKTLPVSGPEVRLAFSPDSKTLVSVGKYRGELRLWEVSTGKELARHDTYETFTGPWETLEFVVRSPDGKTIATACADSTIKLWDLPPAGKAIVISPVESKKKAPGDPAVVGAVREAVADLLGAFAAGKVGKIPMVEKAQVVWIISHDSDSPRVMSVKEFAEIMGRSWFSNLDKVTIEIEVEPTGPGLAVAKVNLKLNQGIQQFVVVYHGGRICSIVVAGRQRRIQD